MSDPDTKSDPRRLVAQGIYAALLAAQKDAGDAALCDALDLLARGTGQNKFQHAANILRGTVLGRRAIDDREALRRIRDFSADRQHEAVGIVAGQMAKASGEKAGSIERRLR